MVGDKLVASTVASRQPQDIAVVAEAVLTLAAAIGPQIGKGLAALPCTVLPYSDLPCLHLCPGLFRS